MKHDHSVGVSSLPTDAWRSLPTLSAALSPDGTYLAIAYRPGAMIEPVERRRVHVYDVASGEEVCCLPGVGEVIVVGWIAPTQLLVFRRHDARILDVYAVHPDGERVLVKIRPASAPVG